jgi:hypothetical protein
MMSESQKALISKWLTWIAVGLVVAWLTGLSSISSIYIREVVNAPPIPESQSDTYDPPQCVDMYNC